MVLILPFLTGRFGFIPAIVVGSIQRVELADLLLALLQGRRRQLTGVRLILPGTGSRSGLRQSLGLRLRKQKSTANGNSQQCVNPCAHRY